MDTKSPTVEEALSAMATDGAVPLAERDPLAVPLGDIPLPPAGLADDLDNSDAVAASAKAERVPEVAVLDFVGDDLPVRKFWLKHPFKWEGERIDRITVCQLRTWQMGEIFQRVRAEKREAELYDFYAVMTGLPAKVLRALPAVDGEPIIDAAYDFLPPSLRPESG